MIDSNLIPHCINVVDRLNAKYSCEEEADVAYRVHNTLYPFEFLHNTQGQGINVFNEWVWDSENDGNSFYESEIEDPDGYPDGDELIAKLLELEGEEFENKLFEFCERRYATIIVNLHNVYTKAIKDHKAKAEKD